MARWEGGTGEGGGLDEKTRSGGGTSDGICVSLVEEVTFVPLESASFGRSRKVHASISQ